MRRYTAGPGDSDQPGGDGMSAASRYASRKFIAAMTSLGLTQWALFEHALDSADYKTIMLAVVGGYVAGNVAQKAVEQRQPPKEPAP